MSNFDIGLLSLPVLMLLIFLRMPIGLANWLGPFIVRSLG